MRKLTVLICLLVILLTSCTQGSSVTPESTLTITQTPIATATYTPSPTATNTPFPDLEGRLFFDMNGSGLPDEASFNYDQARLNSPLNQLIREYISTISDSFYQPEQVVGLQKVIDDYISENPDTLKDQLHPVLLNEIDDYVDANPGIKDGDLITIDEPGLPGYTVCVQNNCVQTDEEGNFSLPNPSGASRASIKITDPYADFPAWAMRYINNWKGAVVVKAYTVAADPQTMARLTTIPRCDADLAALVCKLDEATLQLRDQYLNDTSIIPIANGTSIKSGADNNVGLMQGFLTLPFVSKQVPKPFIWGYFDILGNYFYDDAGKHTSQYNQDGDILAYDGNKRNNEGDWRKIALGELVSGVGDSHDGLDYALPIGNYILSGLSTAKVFGFSSPTDPELRVNIWFEDPTNPGEFIESGGTHMSVQLTMLDQTIYRGQIIGLSGDSGSYPPGLAPQQDHFGLSNRVQGGWKSRDPYRTIITLSPLPNNYWGSDVSYWTSDNTPQFSLP